MQQGMWRYKVFRQKFKFETVGLLSAVVVLACLAYIFYSAQWISDIRMQANEMFHSAEQTMREYETLIDRQLDRFYGDRELVRDLAVFMSSRTEDEYIAGRGINSQTHSARVRSVPEEIRSYLGRHSSHLLRVSTSSVNGNCNIMKFFSNTQTYYSVTKVYYNVPETVHALGENIQQDVAIAKPVYNPYNAYSLLGEMRFWFDRRSVVPFMVNSPFRFAALIDQNGNISFLSPHTEGDKALLLAIHAQGGRSGKLSDGAFNRVFFTSLESSNYGYTLITCIDDATMLRRHSGTLFFTLAVFLAIALLFLLFSYYSLCYDAHFLGHIMNVIDAVRHGNFPAESKALAESRKQNEYSLISSELTDMSRKLQRHIETEYELKLRQKETEMLALQRQINPHFLYNTLETIRAKALIGKDHSTAEAIAWLGSLYRDMVKKQDVITIGDELVFLEKYLKIMAFKHPENFFYHVEVDPALMSVPTVKFWMQPLAENFFIHGFQSGDPFNHIFVRGVQDNDNRYLIEMINNGAEIPPEELKRLNQMKRMENDPANASIGISNVYTRLSFFYGEGFEMRIANNHEGGVCVSLTIPQEEG